MQRVKISMVGCGFVADYYMTTLAGYPWLEVAGVYDMDAPRLKTFTGFYGLKGYESLDALLADKEVSIILNLTNPRAHFEISERCLEAGFHVYSEKPLAMAYVDAERLVQLAEDRGLVISSAPCSLLGVAAQTLWRGVRDQAMGKVRLVYAELDDGMVHKMPYKKWRSASGAPWPYKDEFEVGCTLEHTGYYLSWLIAMFGPVETVVAHSACLIPDKAGQEVLEPTDTPDYSVGILVFANGVVARLSTTIVGPHDHSIRIIGDEGVLSLKDCWLSDGKVTLRKLMTIRRKTFLSPIRIQYRLPDRPRVKLRDVGGNRMDFAAGVAELALSLFEERPSRLSPRFSLHVNEVAIALHNAGVGVVYKTRSRFDPVQPLPWSER